MFEIQVKANQIRTHFIVILPGTNAKMNLSGTSVMNKKYFITIKLGGLAMSPAKWNRQPKVNPFWKLYNMEKVCHDAQHNDTEYHYTQHEDNRQRNTHHQTQYKNTE
jgi:hypothetical protein